MLSSTLMFPCTCQHFTADITLCIVIKAFITPNFSNGWILENLRKWQNLKPFIINTNSPSLRFLQLKVPILEEKVTPKKYLYKFKKNFHLITTQGSIVCFFPKYIIKILIKYVWVCVYVYMCVCVSFPFLFDWSYGAVDLQVDKKGI